MPVPTPLHRWLCDEAAAGDDFVDAEAAGLDLVETGSPGVGDGSRIFASASGQMGNAAAPLGDRTALHGEWTVGVYMKRSGAAPSLDGPIFCGADVPGRFDPDGNCLLGLYVAASDNFMTSHWNAGVPDVTISQTGTLAVPVGEWVRVYTRKEFNGVDYDVTHRVGDDSEDFLGVATSDNGANAIWSIGSHGNFDGEIGEVSFWDAALTDEEIDEDAATFAEEAAVSDPVGDVSVTTRSVTRALKQLLPRGRLWLLELGSYLDRILVAISDELVRILGRGEDLIEESDPRTATETLEDWERMLGLPDEVITTIPATDAARRLAITQKLIRQGGQHAGFYVALAAACGYTVTIDDSYGEDVFRAGTAVAGDALGGLWSAFQWGVTVTATAATALTHAELEAVIRRAAPAHTSVVFTY